MLAQSAIRIYNRIISTCLVFLLFLLNTDADTVKAHAVVTEGSSLAAHSKHKYNQLIEGWKENTDAAF